MPFVRQVHRLIIWNGMGNCGLDWSGSGYGPVANSCEHGDERSGYLKCWKHLDKLSNSYLYQEGPCSIQLVEIPLFSLELSTTHGLEQDGSSLQLWAYVHRIYRSWGLSRYSDGLLAGQPRNWGLIPSRGMIFHSSTASRPALGLTQPLIQWVLGAVSLRLKRPGSEAGHSLPFSAKVKNGGAIPPLIHMSSWHSA
jgi:hypothetical protein